MRGCYIGIDNGVTGTIGIIRLNKEGVPLTPSILKVPVFTEQNWTKKKQQITRVHTKEFFQIIKAEAQWMLNRLTKSTAGEILIIIENPFMGQNVKTTVSAHRCLEAQLVCIDWLKNMVPYKGHIALQYCSSKAWQRPMLGMGAKRTSAEWKALSMQRGLEKWPMFLEYADQIPDMDGLWIAEWARRERL